MFKKFETPFLKRYWKWLSWGYSYRSKKNLTPEMVFNFTFYLFKIQPNCILVLKHFFTSDIVFIFFSSSRSPICQTRICKVLCLLLALQPIFTHDFYHWILCLNNSWSLVGSVLFIAKSWANSDEIGKLSSIKGNSIYISISTFMSVHTCMGCLSIHLSHFIALSGS